MEVVRHVLPEAERSRRRGASADMPLAMKLSTNKTLRDRTIRDPGISSNLGEFVLAFNSIVLGRFKHAFSDSSGASVTERRVSPIIYSIPRICGVRANTMFGSVWISFDNRAVPAHFPARSKLQTTQRRVGCVAR